MCAPASIVISSHENFLQSIVVVQTSQTEEGSYSKEPVK
jgi:hypothetical protein